MGNSHVKTDKNYDKVGQVTKKVSRAESKKWTDESSKLFNKDIRRCPSSSSNEFTRGGNNSLRNSSRHISIATNSNSTTTFVKNPPLQALSRGSKGLDRRGSRASTKSSISEQKAPPQIERRMSKRVSGSSISEKDRVRFEKPVTYGSSKKKEEIVLTKENKEMIKVGWENSRHTELGNRVYIRVLEKRPDLQGLYDKIGKQTWLEEGKLFTLFLDKIIQNLDSLEEIEWLSKEFGRKHVDWRQNGFKPDFWVTVADSMTTECLYLDEGVHPPAEVIEAWGSLVTLMFGSMRDGYYDRLREERRASKKICRHPSVATSQSSVSSDLDNEGLPQIQDLNMDNNLNNRGSAQRRSIRDIGISAQQNGKSTAVIISDYFEP